MNSSIECERRTQQRNNMSILSGGPIELDPSSKLNFVQYFFDRFNDDPDHVLLIDGVTHKKYTRKWILERTHRYVQIIHSFGLQEGDVVGLCSENTIDMACIVYATLYLGLTLNPLNFLYTRAELRHMLSLTRPSIMFCSPAVEQLIVKTLSEDFPASARPLVIVIGDEKKFATNSTEELFKTTAKQSMEKIPICKVNPEENIAGIFSSSGTTGAAKGVSITQAAFNFNLQVVKEVIYTVPECEVKVLIFLPWFHLMGFFNLVYLPFAKIQTIFMTRFEPNLVLSTIQSYRITSLLLVPPIVVFLAKDSLVDNFDLSSVREIYSGAASLQAETEQAVYKRFPSIKVIRQGYGMTEGLTLLLPPVPPKQHIKQGAVGLLTKGTQAKVVDPDSGVLLGANQPGELRFLGPQLMKNYFNNPEATREAFDEEGFLKTGDVGYYDNEGYFFIVDRIKDLIKYKAFQVPPAELETLLLSHPQILDAAVIGIPDERCGELPMAFVVRKPRIGQNTELSEQDVIDFVAKEMSPAKRLHGGCRFVEMIPKNPSGKILRRVLREDVLSKQVKHKL